MKTIEVDDDLYRYIASHTHHIGESASDILRRMLNISAHNAEVSGHEISASSAATVADKAAINTESQPETRNRSMRALLLSDDYAQQKSAVQRFIMILDQLYQIAPPEFARSAESLQGRTRLYFSNDEKSLLQHGVHTKPKQITNTPYWVITNTNSARKCSMIEHIMLSMNFPQELVDKVCGTI